MEEFSYVKKNDCSYSTRLKRKCEAIEGTEPMMKCKEMQSLFERCGNNNEIEVELRESETTEPLSSDNSLTRSRMETRIDFNNEDLSTMFKEFGDMFGLKEFGGFNGNFQRESDARDSWLGHKRERQKPNNSPKYVQRGNIEEI